jgi:hypothetical protein
MRNGLMYHDDENEVTKLYELCMEIFKSFNEDVRSVDFSKIQIALSSILLASEIIGGKVVKKVKMTLQKVYDVKIENLIPSYVVVKR